MKVSGHRTLRLSCDAIDESELGPAAMHRSNRIILTTIPISPSSINRVTLSTLCMLHNMHYIAALQQPAYESLKDSRASRCAGFNARAGGRLVQSPHSCRTDV